MCVFLFREWKMPFTLLSVKSDSISWGNWTRRMTMAKAVWTAAVWCHDPVNVFILWAGKRFKIHPTFIWFSINETYKYSWIIKPLCTATHVYSVLPFSLQWMCMTWLFKAVQPSRPQTLQHLHRRWTFRADCVKGKSLFWQPSAVFLGMFPSRSFVGDEIRCTSF